MVVLVLIEFGSRPMCPTLTTTSVALARGNGDSFGYHSNPASASHPIAAILLPVSIHYISR